MVEVGGKVKLTAAGVASFEGGSIGEQVSTDTVGVVTAVDEGEGAVVVYARFDGTTKPMFLENEGWALRAKDYEPLPAEASDAETA